MDLIDFPSLSRGDLRDIRVTIDGGFREFTRAYGEPLEKMFHPIQTLLTFIEDLSDRHALDPCHGGDGADCLGA